jgi:hypothetical protein
MLVVDCGERSDQEIRRSRSPSIEVTGTVSTFVPIMANNDGCSPLTYGVGIQNKILERHHVPLLSLPPSRLWPA